MKIIDDWVKLSNGVEITKFPVMENNGLSPERCTYTEAAEFAKEHGYRLPTEHEESGAFDCTFNFGLWMLTSTIQDGNPIVRGGSWYSLPRLVRASNRLWFGPELRDYIVGFRCVRETTD